MKINLNDLDQFIKLHKIDMKNNDILEYFKFNNNNFKKSKIKNECFSKEYLYNEFLNQNDDKLNQF